LADAVGFIVFRTTFLVARFALADFFAIDSTVPRSHSNKFAKKCGG
jgi:hypothetical protein